MLQNKLPFVMQKPFFDDFCRATVLKFGSVLFMLSIFVMHVYNIWCNKKPDFFIQTVAICCSSCIIRKNLAFHRNIFKKRKWVLIDSSNYCVHSSAWHQNFANSISKVICNMKCEDIHDTFHISYIKMCWSVLYFQWKFYPWMIQLYYVFIIQKYWFIAL